MVDRSSLQPCEEWAEKLALLQVEDLPTEQSKALAQHVLRCPGCRATLEDYRLINAYMRRVVLVNQVCSPPEIHYKHWRARMQWQKMTLRVLNISRFWPLLIPLFVGGATFGFGFILYHLPGFDGRLAFVCTLAPVILIGLLIVGITMRQPALSRVRVRPVPLWQRLFRRRRMAAQTMDEARLPASSIAQFAQSLALDKLSSKRAWRDRRMLLIVVLSLIAAMISTFVLPFTSPALSINGQPANLKHLSDGSLALDLNRPDGDLKHQAAAKVVAGNRQLAQSLWQQAVLVDSNDAEAWIYLEDQSVLASRQPYVSLVVCTILAKEHIGGGRDILQGAYIAQKEANAQARLHGGKLLRIVIADIGFDDASAVQVAQQIVLLARQDTTLVGVLGWPTSGSTLAALHVLSNAHIPMVSSTASSDELSGKSPYFFRVVPTDALQGRVAAQYAQTNLHATQVELFYDPDNSYSRSLARAFMQNFVDGSHHVTAVRYTRGRVESLTAGINQVATLHPDLIYFAGYVSDASVVLKSLPPCQNVCLKMMGGDALYVQGDYSLEAFSSYKRLYFTSFAFPDEWKGEQPAFFAQYTQAFDPHNQYQQKKYGYNLPDADAILAYDAMRTLLWAVSQVVLLNKSLTPEAVRQALSQLTNENAIQGVSGPLAFASNGDALAKPVLILAGQPDGSTTLCYVQGQVQLP
ncbi:ABC transporter substrate-binding protein [Tengunoibacter tsumagoiensis]|uniref:Leucine-binding protein domain-containing protein n=1 Tax=Tengunoibacter tsumagoiensis TaxID=2014871 RepID=A0A402A5K9_9CHLR|nr:ABC transporter substrate-binding protein [Tengunoibacter tsumagoiensis]GCE14427.1 hypothetical protein KTT_42860 [Tengunoibacter tsumagoiensis]